MNFLWLDAPLAIHATAHTKDGLAEQTQARIEVVRVPGSDTRTGGAISTSPIHPVALEDLLDGELKRRAGYTKVEARFSILHAYTDTVAIATSHSHIAVRTVNALGGDAARGRGVPSYTRVGSCAEGREGLVACGRGRAGARGGLEREAGWVGVTGQRAQERRRPEIGREDGREADDVRLGLLSLIHGHAA